MIRERAPRAAFELAPGPSAMVRRRLALTLKQHLSRTTRPILHLNRFLFLFPMTSLTVASEGCKIVVFIRPHKRSESTPKRWHIIVDPLLRPGALEKLPIDEREKWHRNLLRVSSEVHAALVGVSGIARLRWFFDGWDPKQPGVSTPAELPWHANVLRPVNAAATYTNRLVKRREFWP